MRSKYVRALVGAAGINVVMGQQSPPSSTSSSTVVNTTDTTTSRPTSTPPNLLTTTTFTSTQSTSKTITIPPLSIPSCIGETLNVIGATLDWWYPSIVYDAVSTLSYITGADSSTIGYTIVPATTSFDLTSALETPSCSASCTTTAAPVAAGTTVITQKAYIALPTNAGTGTPPNVVATPAPATISIPGGGTPFSEGTAFIYFSSYELITRLPTIDSQGSLTCGTKTSEYPMSSPFSFAYDGPNPNGASYATAGVTGPVNPAFLGVVNATAATAGYWLAAPTVAIVVQQVLAVAEGPPSTQQSATQLQTITPTLPPFLTPLGPIPTGPPPFTGFPPGQETTAVSLQIPTPTYVKPPPPVTTSIQTPTPETTFVTSEGYSSSTNPVQVQSSTLPSGTTVPPYNGGSVVQLEYTIIWLTVSTWLVLWL